MTAPRRVGLFGGSFDPPHLAHRALAEAALDQLGLDEVVWLPAGRPWQKEATGRSLAPPAHRLAMLGLALADASRFRIDDREIRRPGPSYTIDTLRELQSEASESSDSATDWWLLLGQDQYARLDGWRDWPEVLARAGVAVAARGASSGLVAAPAVVRTPHRLRRLELTALPHSSTEIRRLAAAGADLAPLVGAAVARYIARHSLYRPPAEH